MTSSLLELDNVTKRFGRVVIAEDLSFAVGPGEVVGIVGPNGAGKTSLFGLISGDLAPGAGEVRFAGRTVTLEDVRGAGLIVMQEGAGVRQLIEAELQRAGRRLRDLDIHLELGLQESVTNAVRAGYGVTFISRTSVESDLTAGTLAESRVEGLQLERDIYLVRASGRSETRAARAFVEFARDRLQ